MTTTTDKLREVLNDLFRVHPEVASPKKELYDLLDDYDLLKQTINTMSEDIAFLCDEVRRIQEMLEEDDPEDGNAFEDEDLSDNWWKDS